MKHGLCRDDVTTTENPEVIILITRDTDNKECTTTSKEGAVAQVFSEEWLHFSESPSFAQILKGK
jgi:hypothetical protein